MRACSIGNAAHGYQFTTANPHTGHHCFMVERSQRGKRKKKLLASHQRSWLWGRNLVQETLRAGRWPIVDLYLADDLPAEQIQTAQEFAAVNQTKLQIEPRDSLNKRCHSAEHQGYLALVGEFP